VRKAGFAIVGIKITRDGDIDIATDPPSSNNESVGALKPRSNRTA
jgi:hypothetical protein